MPDWVSVEFTRGPRNLECERRHQTWVHWPAELWISCTVVPQYHVLVNIADSFCAPPSSFAVRNTVEAGFPGRMQPSYLRHFPKVASAPPPTYQSTTYGRHCFVAEILLFSSFFSHTQIERRLQMVCWMIDKYGTNDQRSRFVPALTCMDSFGSYCLTEAGSGSDAAAMRTTAVRKGTYRSIEVDTALVLLARRPS